MNDKYEEEQRIYRETRHKMFEDTRELFEDRCFCDYFMKGISFQGGPLAITKHNLFKDELMERDEHDNDDYKRDEISAMWNGWKLCIEFKDRLPA